MTDLNNEWKIGIISFRDSDTYKEIDWLAARPLFKQYKTFTRSDGTIFSRIYERLTKASRRREPDKEAGWYSPTEQAYRHGVKDTLEALRKELS